MPLPYLVAEALHSNRNTSRNSQSTTITMYQTNDPFFDTKNRAHLMPPVLQYILTKYYIYYPTKSRPIHNVTFSVFQKYRNIFGLYSKNIIIFLD